MTDNFEILPGHNFWFQGEDMSGQRRMSGHPNSDVSFELCRSRRAHTHFSMLKDVTEIGVIGSRSFHFLSYPPQPVFVWICWIWYFPGKVGVTWLRKTWTTATTMTGKVSLIHTTTVTLSTKLHLNRDGPLATVDLKADYLYEMLFCSNKRSVSISHPWNFGIHSQREGALFKRLRDNMLYQKW